MIDKECLYEYNIAENKDVCLEANAAKLSDGKALEIIKNITKLENPADLQKMPVDVQKECIINMRNGGLSVRQICRLTGVSFGLVRSSGSEGTGSLYCAQMNPAPQDITAVVVGFFRTTIPLSKSTITR